MGCFYKRRVAVTQSGRCANMGVMDTVWFPDFFQRKRHAVAVFPELAASFAFRDRCGSEAPGGTGVASFVRMCCKNTSAYKHVEFTPVTHPAATIKGKKIAINVVGALLLALFKRQPVLTTKEWLHVAVAFFVRYKELRLIGTMCHFFIAATSIW